MTRKGTCSVVIMIMVAAFAAQTAMAQEEMKAPVSTENEIFTIKGEFTRIAYNNEGWVTLGYRTANGSQGDQWMLLDAGVTVFKGRPNQKLTRASFSVKMPDGSMVPMASQREFQEAGYLRGLNRRADTVRDSINYFPNQAAQACPMLFFSDPANSNGALSFDEFEVSWQRGCVGRLFFKLPDGQTIEPGQYWLSVKFAGSTVEAPLSSRISIESRARPLPTNAICASISSGEVSSSLREETINCLISASSFVSGLDSGMGRVEGCRILWEGA